MRWRVDRKFPLNVFDGDHSVCQCPTAGDARRIAAAMNACLQIKSFLDRLEEGTAPDDPLRALRQQFHAPMHAALDEALESRV